MRSEAFQQQIPQESPSRSKRSLTNSEKIFHLLDRTGSFNVRKSDERLEEWLQNLSYEDFSEYVTRINGILRDIPIKKRSVDGGNVEVARGIFDDVAYLPPPSEQKDILMREAFDALKQIHNNEDRALLLYYVLQSVHPYSDGNGRTGRLLYTLFSEEGKTINKGALSELVDHDMEGDESTQKGRDSFKKKVWEADKAYYLINREVVKDIFGNNFLEEYGRIYYTGLPGKAVLPERLKLTLPDRRQVEKILGESEVLNFCFSDLVIVKFLQDTGRLEKCLIPNDGVTREKQVVPQDVGKKMLGINDDRFLEGLTEGDIARLIEIHKEIKIRFIRKMIDIFKNPDEYRLKETEDGEPIPIKDIFRS